MDRKRGCEQSLLHRQKRVQPQLQGGSDLECSCVLILPTRVVFRNGAGCKASGFMPCLDMPIDTQWFNDRILAQKTSQRKLAKLMGLDASALSLSFRGKRKLSIEEASQLAVLLNASLPEVLTAMGAPPAADRVKIIGYIAGDCSVQLEADGIHETVALPPNLPQDTVALQAHTARTSQHPIDGWLYFISESKCRPEQTIGTVSVCAVKNNGLLIGHVERGYRAGTYNLMLNTGETKKNLELAWACPILWIKTTTGN